MLVYHTHFCCIGVGYRSLTETELAHAFGFPILSRTGGIEFAEFDHFLPAHLFHFVLESKSLVRLGRPSETASISLLSRLPLYKFPCETRS
jgi:hypothetical protein